MLYRKLGRTKLMVSCIGFGGLPLAGLDEEGADSVLHTALDCGINFIDTARGYRASESLIGQAISGRRKEYYIATKTKARDENSIMQELEKSLENLKTDTLDLYQVHYVNTLDELKHVLARHGALSVLQKLRREGVIRFIGITAHDARVLLDAAQTGMFDSVQGAFSYVERTRQMLDLIRYCEESSIGFIVQKPLAGGAIEKAGAGLKWILRHPVSTVIPGMISMKQVLENTGVADGDLTLTADEREELDAIAGRLDNYFCRRCYYCHPVCPENIRIGVILEFYGKAQYPENLALLRQWYGGFSINAHNCTECGLCLQECPYGLPIIDMLKASHALLR
jgi:predicted aldo/keto reductase-like oxidoreductase